MDKSNECVRNPDDGEMILILFGIINIEMAKPMHSISNQLVDACLDFIAQLEPKY